MQVYSARTLPAQIKRHRRRRGGHVRRGTRWGGSRGYAAEAVPARAAQRREHNGRVVGFPISRISAPHAGSARNTREDTRDEPHTRSLFEERSGGMQGRVGAQARAPRKRLVDGGRSHGGSARGARALSTTRRSRLSGLPLRIPAQWPRTHETKHRTRNHTHAHAGRTRARRVPRKGTSAGR